MLNILTPWDPPPFTSVASPQNCFPSYFSHSFQASHFSLSLHREAIRTFLQENPLVPSSWACGFCNTVYFFLLRYSFTPSHPFPDHFFHVSFFQDHTIYCDGHPIRKEFDVIQICLKATEETVTYTLGRLMNSSERDVAE